MEGGESGQNLWKPTLVTYKLGSDPQPKFCFVKSSAKSYVYLHSAYPQLYCWGHCTTQQLVWENWRVEHARLDIITMVTSLMCMERWTATANYPVTQAIICQILLSPSQWERWDWFCVTESQVQLIRILLAPCPISATIRYSERRSKVRKHNMVISRKHSVKLKDARHSITQCSLKTA